MADRKIFVFGSTECVLFVVEVENLRHFLLEEQRRISLHMQRPYAEELDDVTGAFLFENPEEMKKINEVLLRMWRRRCNGLREVEERRQQRL